MDTLLPCAPVRHVAGQNGLEMHMGSLVKAAGILAALSFAVAPIARAAETGTDKKIEKMWKAKCSSCHGMDGKGQTAQGKKEGVRDMTTAAYQKEVTDDRIKTSLKDGVKKNGNEVMPAFGDLKDDQVEGLVKHIRALGGKK